VEVSNLVGLEVGPVEHRRSPQRDKPARKSITGF